MDFYTNPLSPNCRKVDAVAKQLGIPLVYKTIDLVRGENKTPEFLAINPNGKIPALVDGDVNLWESNAIVCYIASKTENDLWPKTNARYDIMRWQAWELAHFGAAARALAFQRILKPLFGLGKPDPARCEEEERNFKRYAAVLDQALSNKRFLVGDRLTIADFCVGSALTHAEASGLPLAGFDHMKRWAAALDEQPGWSASRPPPM
jgi:glutathione S-transferase